MNSIFNRLMLTLIAVLACSEFINAQEKIPMDINDARLWRRSSVELSPDAKWYATLYRLQDKSENKKDTVLQKLVEKTSEEFYTDNNKTDVLYIHSVKRGLKYEIPDGSSPKFSNNSKWIAYKIVKESDDGEKKKDSTFIELKNLEDGFTVNYESKASYDFPENKNLFISESGGSLLIYDLAARTEHYIGDVGEFVVNEKSDLIAYTIDSEDKRGNGIYLYNPKDRSTKTIISGNDLYANLGWNHDATALAAYEYQQKEKEIDRNSVSILIFEGISRAKTKKYEYPIASIKDLREIKSFAIEAGSDEHDIVWAKDNKRLFLRLKDAEALKEDDGDEKESTVQVWHWKDKKLLSERIKDAEYDTGKTYRAIFFRESEKIIELTNEERQNYIISEGNDEWAIGTDNRKYLSDWDVNTHDLYRINLKTGEMKQIETAYRSSFGNQVQISPDGDKAILWDEKDYYFYDIAKDTKINITENLPVSFIDEEYDKWGWGKNYGFTGWVKGQDAILLNHKYDIWLVPYDGKKLARNLTEKARNGEPIRLRWADKEQFTTEKPEERYVDLEEHNFLTAFHTKTKYSGFFKLENGKVSKVTLDPAFYFAAWYPSNIYKAEKSDAVLFSKGDPDNFFETYITDVDFKNPKKLTSTNPHDERYISGNRILVEYTNDDGVPLQGTLTIPETYKKGDKLPMIVYTYEKLSYLRYFYSSPRVGSTASEPYYVSNGYLFFEPDIHFNIGTPHSDMHECINAAIEKVIELGYVDPDRIGYNGFSFGGHTGMYVATQKDNKFAAISAGAGVSNLTQGFTIDIVRDGSSEQDYYMTSQGRLGNDPTGDTEMYIRESSVYNAATMDTPLLLYHGTEDNVVQWEHSFGYYNLLRYLKKPVVFLSYRGEGHGLRQEENKLDFTRRLKAYFDHYLKGEPAEQWMVEEIEYKSEKKDEKEKTGVKWK